MALVTAQSIAFAAGLEATYAAVNSEDTVKIDDEERHFLHVKNGGGGGINVTIPAVKTSTVVQGVGTVAIDDVVVAVGAGEEHFNGPITKAYADTDDIATLQYSGTTSVTAAVLKLPEQS